MWPIAQPLAYGWAASAGALMLLGLVMGSVEALVLGSGLAVLWATLLAVTMPLGRRARGAKVEFAWWLAHQRGSQGGAGQGVVAGGPLEVRAYVRNRGPFPMRLQHAQPLTHSTQIHPHVPFALEVPPHSRTEFSFVLVPKACGRVVLHGLALQLSGPLGLFSVPLYFPNPLSVIVLPRSSQSLSMRSRLLGGEGDRPGASRLQRRGAGTELHELRDLQPGDPFNAIAWKPSARRGKLLVREVESEVQRTVYFALDTSSTMRGGRPGTRRLDLALEWVTAQAKRALTEGHRVGLLTFDTRVGERIAASEGRPHLMRLYERLVATTEVVDEDLTEPTDAEVLAMVGTYLRAQDGVEYLRAHQWDTPALLRHIKGHIAGQAPQASSAVGMAVRAFCQVRGLPIAHRTLANPSRKTEACVHAVQEAMRLLKGPGELHLVTDLQAMNPEDIAQCMGLARRHGMKARVAAVLRGPEPGETRPATVEAKRAPTDRTLSEDLDYLYDLGDRRRYGEAQGTFGRVGVPVFEVQTAYSEARGRAKRPAAQSLGLSA